MTACFAVLRNLAKSDKLHAKLYHLQKLLFMTKQ